MTPPPTVQYLGLPSFAGILVSAVLIGLPSCTELTNEWQTVTETTLAIEVPITGTLKAKNSVEIRSPSIVNQWVFIIQELAPDGENVAIGDPLVSFDPSTIQEELTMWKSEREENRIRLSTLRQKAVLAAANEDLAISQARADLRVASLAAAQSAEMVSHLDLQKAKLALQAAQTTLAHTLSQKKLHAANRNYEQSNLQNQLALADRKTQELTEQIDQLTITATHAGIVFIHTNPRSSSENSSSKKFKSNKKFKIGDFVPSRSPILAIASLDAIAGEGFVAEADMGKLTNGQNVLLRLDTYPDLSVSGTLSKTKKNVQYKFIGGVEKNVVAVELDIAPIKGSPLRPGMSFRGEIEIERIKNALVLPKSVVFGSKEGPIVYKKTTNGVKKTPVTLGKENRDTVQILSGVSPNDSVSVHNHDTTSQ